MSCSRPTRAAAAGHPVHRAADQADAAAVGLGGADRRCPCAPRWRRSRPRRPCPSARRSACSARSRTSASEPASPSTKTLVESQTMASTPSSPRRRMASMSVGRAEQRVGVDLPVAGVQDRAQRRADRQAVGLGDRVGEGDQVDLERAERDRAAERHLGDRHLVQQAGLAQLLADQEGGEGRGVERAPSAAATASPAAPIWSSWAWVSTMPRMSSACSSMKAGIGQDDLDAGRGLVAEGHAQVDHDPLAGVGRAEAVQVEVHADLVRPAERQEDEFVVWIGVSWRSSVSVIAPWRACCGGQISSSAADGEVGIERVDGCRWRLRTARRRRRWRPPSWAGRTRP